MTAELFELTCCSSGLAFKSQLLRRPKEHHSFMLKLSHHGGKTSPYGLKNLKNLAYAKKRISFGILWFLRFFIRPG